MIFKVRKSSLPNYIKTTGNRDEAENIQRAILVCTITYLFSCVSKGKLLNSYILSFDNISVKYTNKEI